MIKLKLSKGLLAAALALLFIEGRGMADQAPEADFTSVDLAQIESPFQPSKALTISKSSLSGSYAYPVPFMPSLGDRRIIFANLTPEAHIEVRTLHGDIVRELDEKDGNGELVWDVKNSRGEALSSDVYFYTVRSGQQEKIGKLVVLR